MAAPIRLYMSMSVDGYIAGPDDREGQELGRDGGRVFNWLDDRNGPGINGQVYREAMDTGALISGRRTFELAQRWHGDHHNGVPIFVLTHRFDDDDVPPGTARFCTDVVEAATAAREAAGDRAVMVHGAGAAQALLQAGQLDELEIHLVPVLLGAGRRLFGDRDRNHIELELVRRLEGRDVTHLRYRVKR
ncbi:MAG TPA: dihydrofolate reductase family protein [Nocardioidaceae bacterium]|nr:dihydrofolate reductase family protein [Nocardioidaceae bacterium]